MDHIKFAVGHELTKLLEWINISKPSNFDQIQEFVYHEILNLPTKTWTQQDVSNALQKWIQLDCHIPTHSDHKVNLETYFDVVAHIVETCNTEGSIAYCREQYQGSGGLFELAEELANEFDLLYKDHFWDGDYPETIEAFLHSKEQQHLKLQQ